MEHIVTRFNKICFNKNAIQAIAQMAADKEAVGLNRDFICTNLSVSCPYEIIVYSVLKHINATRIHAIS